MSYILRVVCADQPGIVLKFSQLIYDFGGTLVASDQHTDLETQTFFMRLEWTFHKKVSNQKFSQTLKKIAASLNASYQLIVPTHRCRMAIFVSKFAHCLYDLLARHELKEFDVDIPLIISNHPNLKPIADHFKIPFHVVPIHAENKSQAENEEIALLKLHKIDLIVLARYMQVLSPRFVKLYPNQIINIHHSFLPAFIGAKPYHAAYARGVKLIGATSHYVTQQIDDGPIIHQSVTSVTHRDQVEDLVQKGRDQEKLALAHAVKMHLEHRILTHENKTIVFV